MAGQLIAGDVLLLTGAMGAGKSELCRGIARGLGISGPVTSPTFTILNVYEEADIPFHHFDFYRISSAEEMLAGGLDEWIGGEAVTAIEWHERVADVLPPDCLEIRIISSDDGLQHEISFIPQGSFRDLDYEKIFPGSRGAAT